MSVEVTSEGIPVELAGKSIPLRRDNDFIRTGELEVYAPRAFKATTMLIGSETSPVALCTCWADPWQVVSEETVDTFSIMAPLRTPMGINVLLWNLARNPQIRHLGVSAGSDLDKTEKGAVAKQYLEALWRNGLEDNGVIKGTSFHLLPELVANGGVDIIRKVIENVSIYDWSQANENQLQESVNKLPLTERYMEPHKFPEFEIKIPETFPSERTSLVVREAKLFNAWLRLLDRILMYGEATQLETGGAKVKELEFARVVIEEEDAENFYFPEWAEKMEELKISRDSLDWYFKNRILPHPYMKEIYPEVWKFIRGPKDPAYLYSELIFAFPRSKEIDKAYLGILDRSGIDAVYKILSDSYPISQEKEQKAREVMSDSSISEENKVEILLELFIPPVNQVAKAIERIKSKPDDADKTFVLWDPFVHGMRDRSRPCLMYVAALVRDGKIDMETIWRSHDIAKGWPENLYGMLRLQHYIAQETGYKSGHLIASSQSAHIYLNDLSWTLKLQQKELISKDEKLVFRAEVDSDPRGNVSISVVNGKIVMILQEPKTSAPLLRLEGTAREISYQLKRRQLLSRFDHSLDIGSELQKAELSRLLGFPYYVQDKPIDFRNLKYGG